MILENYNDSLKENIESERSFTVSEFPILRVRPFDSMQYCDEDFILPYFVDNFLNTGYKENKLTNTFTVVVSLDEDTKPEEEVARNYRWSQTTYSGEQIINLGKLEQGEHTLSIKAIEDTGIASGTRFFKFYVSKPKSEINLVDFTEIDTFTVSSEDTERRIVPYWYLTPDNGNGGYFPVLLHYDIVSYPNGNESHIDCPSAKITRNLNYTVTFNRDSSNVLTGIDVEVHGTVSIPPHKFNGSSHPGFEGSNAIRLDGTYHITNCVEIDGETHLLNEYLGADSDANGLPFDNPPAKATYTAARNKIGLKYLLWACKAYCNEVRDNQGNGYDGFILPKYEYIVSYANGINCNNQDAVDVFANEPHYNYSIEPKSVNAVDSGSWYRDDIDFPDRIIIDFNYSSIKSLALNVHSGRLVTISYGRLTELRNLEVVGDYASYYRLDGGIDEAKGGVKLHYCTLCTLNNVNISKTAGYELVGNGISHTALNVSIPTFTEYGYLDYEDGKHVDVTALETDGNGYLNNNGYYDVEWDAVPLEHVDALIHSVVDKSVNHTQSQIDDTSISNVMHTGGAPFSLGTAISSDGTFSDNFEGTFHISNTDTTYGYNITYGSSNYRRRMDGDAVFVSFYKKENNAYKFIKTIKMEIWDVGYIPYGATHAKCSAIGAADKDACLIAKLNQSGTQKSVFRFSSPRFMRRANRVINCKVHDIRTTLITVLGHQTYTENFITYNVASEKGGHGEITAFLCDIEDNSMQHYHAWFDRWSNWYGPPSSNILATKHGCNDVCFTESGGFTVSLDSLTKDAFFSRNTLSVTLYPQDTCVVRKEYQFANNVFNVITLSSTSTRPKTEFYLKDCVANRMSYEGGNSDDNVIVEFI